jgi:hypothetical protein
MKLDVKILSGTIETLEVEDNAKAGEVKLILEERTGIAKSEMILLYSGKPLKGL